MEDENDPEVKVVKTANPLIIKESDNALDRIVSYFSDWLKMKKCVAWILYFVSSLTAWKRIRDQTRQEASRYTKDEGQIKELVEAKMKDLKNKSQSEAKERLKVISLSAKDLERQI